MAASALIYDYDIIIIKTPEVLKVFWYEEVADRNKNMNKNKNIT